MRGGGRGRVESGVDLYGLESAERRLGHPVTRQESSRYWTQATLRHVGREPGRFLALLGVKARLMVNREEASQIQSPRVFEAVAGPMGWPFVGGFGVVGWLGLAGLPLALRRSREFRVVAGVLGAVALSMMIFFVVDRYRVHLIPTLALLAPVPARALVEAVRGLAWRRVVPVALALGLSAGCVWPAVCDMSPAWRAFELHGTLANAYFRGGELEEAAKETAKAVEIDRATLLAGGETRNGRFARAAVYELDALLALERGDWARARDGLRTALRLAPGRAQSRELLAEALASEGSRDGARAMLAEGVVDSARVVKDLLSRIRRAGAVGDRKTGEGCLTALAAFAPDLVPTAAGLCSYFRPPAPLSIVHRTSSPNPHNPAVASASRSPAPSRPGALPSQASPARQPMKTTSVVQATHPARRTAAAGAGFNP